MKIEREVGEVVEADSKPKTQKQNERGNLSETGGEKGNFHF
jgi:hypothetical protein